jgi:hypothetical protein
MNFSFDESCTRVKFNGLTYFRYPESPSLRCRNYFKAMGNKMLHREIYKTFNGPIPKGHIIHHLDHNVLNNNPSNLVLLTQSEHNRIHNAERPYPTTNTEYARTRLKEFYQTEEGRALQAKRTAELWKKRRASPGRIITCAQCGNEFETKCTKPVRFCSHRCWQRDYNRNRRDKE